MLCLVAHNAHANVHVCIFKREICGRSTDAMVSSHKKRSFQAVFRLRVVTAMAMCASAYIVVSAIVPALELYPQLCNV